MLSGCLPMRPGARVCKQRRILQTWGYLSIWSAVHCSMEFEFEFPNFMPKMQSRDDEKIPSSAPTESLPLCLRANAVPPGTSAHYNIARAYLVLQRYVGYPKLQLMIRLRDVLILPSNSSSSTDHAEMPHRRSGSNPAEFLLPKQSRVRQHKLLPGVFLQFLNIG